MGAGKRKSPALRPGLLDFQIGAIYFAVVFTH